MEFELRDIPTLSGSGCKIYSVVESGADLSLFEQFLVENFSIHSDEVKNINRRLKFIGMNGARSQFFKENEGLPGDGVCALYDDPNRKLRLYCIRYGSVTVILGGGGEKQSRAWQDDPKLTKEASKMVMISRIISEAIKNRDTKIGEEGFSECKFESYE